MLSGFRLPISMGRRHDGDMFKKIRSAISKIPAADALVTALQNFGLWKWLMLIFATFTTACWAAWVWLTSALPYWAISLLGLFVLAMVLIILHQGIALCRRVFAEHLDQAKVGTELVKLGEDINKSVFEYIQTRARFTSKLTPGDDQSPVERWYNQQEDSTDLARSISSAYGARILAATMTLHQLQIKIPFHLSRMDGGNINGLASYFGAVGNLLREGKISIAQNKDAALDFTISSMIR